MGCTNRGEKELNKVGLVIPLIINRAQALDMTNKEEEFKKRLEAESKEREYKKWKKENDPIEIKKSQKEDTKYKFVYFIIIIPFLYWLYFIK